MILNCLKDDKSCSHDVPFPVASTKECNLRERERKTEQDWSRIERGLARSTSDAYLGLSAQSVRLYGETLRFSRFDSPFTFTAHLPTLPSGVLNYAVLLVSNSESRGDLKFHVTSFPCTIPSVLRYREDLDLI